MNILHNWPTPPALLKDFGGDDTEYQLCAMRWSGELFADEDGHSTQPPFEGCGGWDHVIATGILREVNVYGCRYCGADVYFKNRLPHNMDQTQHRCLADARKKAREAQG